MDQHIERPLSPHLQIYRPQLTSVLSFSHRVSGIALAVGSPVLVYWLIAASMGASAYATLHGFLDSWIGLAVLFCWTYALFYHLCNGIRHLLWDVGYGFELGTIYRSGWTVIGISTLATVAAWFAGVVVGG